MHPLSFFPQLLTFGLVAPTLLRLFVGGFLIFKGKERYSKPYKWTSVVYIISGLLVFVGLYTQIASLIGFFCLGFDDWADKKIAPLTVDAILLHTICAIILISLLFTGPGFLAMDLPL